MKIFVATVALAVPQLLGISLRGSDCNTNIEKMGIQLTTSPVYPSYKAARLDSDEMIVQIGKVGTNVLPVFKHKATEGTNGWVDLDASQ